MCLSRGRLVPAATTASPSPALSSTSSKRGGHPQNSAGVYSGALQAYSQVTSLCTAGSGRRRLGVRALEMHRAVLRLCEGDERAIRQDRGDTLQLHQQVPGGLAVVPAAQGAGREGWKPEGELFAHLKC